MSGIFGMYGWRRTCLETFVKEPERKRPHKIPRF